MKNASRGNWVLVGILILGLAGCAGAGEKTGTYIDDSWITTKVKSDLLAAKDVTSTHISVTTTKGVVTLTGTAATTQESNKAAEIARGVAGVKDVERYSRSVVPSDVVPSAHRVAPSACRHRCEAGASLLEAFSSLLSLRKREV